MLETVKDYLIGLGFAVDQGSFSSVNNLLKQFDQSTLNVAKIAETNLGKTVGLISDSLLTILSESVNVINQVTDADLKVERLARNLWTTEKNARAVTSALSAMGKDPDVDEIYRMTNEEYKRFVDIKNTLSSMELSTQGQEALRFLRDIKGDISMINGMLGYIRQWVVAFMAKYAGTTLTNFRNKVRNFAEYLKKNFIPIAETIGKWLAKGLQLIEALGWGIEKLIGFIVKFKDSLAPFLGTAGILALLKMGPIGWLIFALTSLILILEDIYTYTQGGKSLLGDLMKANVIPESFLDDIQELLANVVELFGYINPILKFIGNEAWIIFQSIIEGIAKGLKEINENIDRLSKRTHWWQRSEEEEEEYQKLIGNPKYSEEEINQARSRRANWAFEEGRSPVFEFDLSNTWLGKKMDGLFGGVSNNNSEITININGADDPTLIAQKTIEAIKANSNWGGIR